MINVVQASVSSVRMTGQRILLITGLAESYKSYQNMFRS